MSRQLSIAPIALGMLIALACWTVSATEASAACGHCQHHGQHGGHGGHEQGSHEGHGSQQHATTGEHQHGAGAEEHDQPLVAPAVPRGPHGGQITDVAPYRFEVVYRPTETRLYLFGKDFRPISPRGVYGRVSMRLRENDKLSRYPLHYVAPNAKSAAGDYLAATADVSRIRDGDMSVTFELAGSPDAAQPQVTFTQTFALSKVPVTVGLLTEFDRAGMDRQRVCPVSGARLGSMGSPVKALLGDQPVYLCCKACLAKVEEDPESYLPKATSTQR